MWSVHFIPAETDHIDVTIDGEFWHRWNSADGDIEVALTRNQYNQSIHVLAIGQEGKNARIEVKWDGQVRKAMKFDGPNGENHDVDH